MTFPIGAARSRAPLAALAVMPLLAALLAHGGARAGSVPIQEAFEKMDLERLPANLAVNGKDKDAVIEIAEQGQRGKTLHLKAAKDGLIPGLQYTLDPKAYAGKPIRFTFKALFPGKYEPNAEKTWERPRVVFAGKQTEEKTWYWGPPYPKPETAEWQTLSGTATVPADIQNLTLWVRIDRRAAEVWYDDLVLELEPGADPPPEPQAEGGVKPRPLNADELAQKAPARELQATGLYFAPDVAVNVRGTLRKSPVKDAAAGKVLWVGSVSEKLPLPPPGYQYAKGPPAVLGHDADALALLRELPDVLLKEKPAFVLLQPGAMREVPESIKADWTDVAVLCGLFGAVPVVVVPDAAKDDDPLRSSLLGAVQESKLPALDARGEALDKRAEQMLQLASRYVLGLGGDAESGAVTGKTAAKTAEEEEE
ncbi:MAG: hypothetical protein M5U26_23595 [Planctomycetota bacterium]|nr:hypothetical protein [Planctomycetota bacterium]